MSPVPYLTPASPLASHGEPSNHKPRSPFYSAQAEQQVAEMCRLLLANPVIEDYRYELEEAAEPRT